MNDNTEIILGWKIVSFVVYICNRASWQEKILSVLNSLCFRTTMADCHIRTNLFTWSGLHAYCIILHFALWWNKQRHISQYNFLFPEGCLKEYKTQTGTSYYINLNYYILIILHLTFISFMTFRSGVVS